jgi:hypothetical protein
MTIDYKFNEGQIMQDIKEYVDKTYDSHYAKTKNYQATEIIIDQGHGTGFCMGNILKYAQRYGKKEGRNKDDLLKVIHYAIIQLSQDHYESLDEPELKSVTSEKYGGEINLETNKFKSVILDDLLKK